MTQVKWLIILSLVDLFFWCVQRLDWCLKAGQHTLGKTGKEQQQILLNCLFTSLRISIHTKKLKYAFTQAQCASV